MNGTPRPRRAFQIKERQSLLETGSSYELCVQANTVSKNRGALSKCTSKFLRAAKIALATTEQHLLLRLLLRLLLLLLLHAPLSGAIGWHRVA